MMKAYNGFIKALEDAIAESKNRDGEYSYILNVDAEKTLELLKEQEPRLMTLEEVVAHYSLPPVFVDDLSAQEDYLYDIEPLYFEYKIDKSWAVHWRDYQSTRMYLDDWKESYGERWRCWTAKPTDEQRKAVKWNE